MKKGFTLIELLVVIAIIAILAAILFPVFAQAREKARASSCLSNTKQIGTAVQLYVDDFDETLPCEGYRMPSGMSTANFKGYPMWDLGVIQHNMYGWGDVSWADQIFPYLKSINILVCPSMKMKSKCYAEWPKVVPTCGYGYNSRLTEYQNSGDYPITKVYSLPELKNPSKMVFVGDCSYQKHNDYGYLSKLCKPEFNLCTPSYATDWIRADRHNGGCNFCFADGHAKYYKTGMQGPLEKDSSGTVIADWQSEYFNPTK